MRWRAPRVGPNVDSGARRAFPFQEWCTLHHSCPYGQRERPQVVLMSYLSEPHSHPRFQGWLRRSTGLLLNPRKITKEVQLRTSFVYRNWRRRADSNRRWRFCRPLPYHLATSPFELVPRRGFEPLHPKARPPQDRVSTYSTTSAAPRLTRRIESANLSLASGRNGRQSKPRHGVSEPRKHSRDRCGCLDRSRRYAVCVGVLKLRFGIRRSI